MRRSLFLGFALLFVVFLSGTGIAISTLLRSAAELRQVVELHQVEKLRSRLRLQVHKTQGDLKVSRTAFAANLDEIIANVRSLEGQQRACLSCHHEANVLVRLEELSRLVADYKSRFSHFVTAVDDDDRRSELQLETVAIGERIEDNIHGLVQVALPALEGRTREAMAKVDRSRQVLSVTVVLTVLIALLVAAILARRIHRPVQELAAAAQRISAGDLGFEIRLREPGDFGRLLEAFNAMSATLRKNKRQIEAYVHKLTSLAGALPSLHATRDLEAMSPVLRSVVESLIEVEHFGFALRIDPEAETCRFFLFSGGEEIPTPGPKVSAQVLRQAHLQVAGQPMMVNREPASQWALGRWPFPSPPRNFLVAWLEIGDQVSGFILLADKVGGDFQDEDSSLLTILASGLVETLDNIVLFDELQHQMDKQRETQQELVQAEKLSALGILSGGVAHDFNNILCAILGHANLLSANATSANERESLTTIEQASHRGADLTRKLLTFSQPSPVEFRRFRINDRVRRVMGLVGRTLDKRVDVVLDLADSEPIVRGDPGEMEQVVMNLCVNARDAIVGGGRLLVRTEEVESDGSFRERCEPADASSYVRVTVEDTGSGIPEELLPRVFEPFFTTKKNDRGTGLGLSIVQRIVRDHGGACSVESAVGGGTRFEIHLPAATGESPLASVEPASFSGAGQKVLIVDDEEMICSFVDSLLRSRGCTTLIAQNGREALDLLTTRDEEIDLMILDLNMPVMSGEEVLERLAATGSRVRVLAISGAEVDKATRRIMRETSTAFLRKPFGVDELASKVSELL